jgi:hypothetical protein
MYCHQEYLCLICQLQQTGTQLHQMRDLMLLTQSHALLGHGRTAMQWAQEMKTYFLNQAETRDGEIAFVHTIDVHAAAVTGDATRHSQATAARQALLIPSTMNKTER